MGIASVSKWHKPIFVPLTELVWFTNDGKSDKIMSDWKECVWIIANAYNFGMLARVIVIFDLGLRTRIFSTGSLEIPVNEIVAGTSEKNLELTWHQLERWCLDLLLVLTTVREAS